MGEEICDGKDKDFDGLVTIASKSSSIIPTENGGNDAGNGGDQGHHTSGV